MIKHYLTLKVNFFKIPLFLFHPLYAFDCNEMFCLFFFSLGAKQLGQNIQEMTGKYPNYFFILCWYIASPLFIIVSIEKSYDINIYDFV